MTGHRCLLLLCLNLLACPDPGQVPDVGAPADVFNFDATSVDGAVADAPRVDSALADATGSPDLAVTADAAGGDARVPDAGQLDAVTGDTGHTVVDSGLPPQGDNILVNGSFEQWSNALPVGWYGAESNLDSAAVVEDLSAAHDGIRACQLINTGSTHRRFTTAATTWPAGDYHCSYWVRGTGEIRNARYTGSYSSYSSYTSIDADTWTELSYSFRVLQEVVDVFELVFSVRNTDAARGHIHIDDVRCTRSIEPCDGIVCESWQSCDNSVPGCVTASGFCADETECLDWQDCGGDHLCATATDRCAGTIDCNEPTPVCDLPSHSCVAGDPCAGVTCDAWKQCNPADALCVLKPDRCMTTADCVQSLPVCDVTTHSCVAVDSAVNVVPNGGFEDWEDVWLGGPSTTTFHLPVSWYGVCNNCSPYYPTTQIAASDVRAYSASVHGGSQACQLVKTGMPGDRFDSEPFAVTPGVTYSCAYWVRGQGSHRQRAYCGATAPDTQYLSVDSDTWQPVTFEINSNSAWCVLIFYASSTDAARDHVQLDDVVCSRKFP
ncbi:MAG: invertase recombinase-like protein [Pseudomonadota bacterium]